jgi:2-polyprenyl-3-methyl-5-hydroxy-6-metoxy-1,4-benzoquinol methylase
VTIRGVPAPSQYLPAVYWEERARRFASEGAGLAAVCSYGMPEFYNQVTHLCQRLALEPWLRVGLGTRVLDVGCGVGRWSRLLAARGAHVTGIDLSPTMIAQAQHRAARAGLLHQCRFLTQDLAALDAGDMFDLVLGVTVLQHILDPQALRSAVRRMTDHLAEGGRMVLLEVAPTQSARHCDSTIFKARMRSEYLELFASCGLRVRTITGVDPAPFKNRLLPLLPRIPKPLSKPALALATALSVPVDTLFGRWAVEHSWHAVFVLERAAGGAHAH